LSNNEIGTILNVKGPLLHLIGYMVPCTKSEKACSYCSEGLNCGTTSRTHWNHFNNIKPYSFRQGPKTSKLYKLLTFSKNIEITITRIYLFAHTMLLGEGIFGIQMHKLVERGIIYQDIINSSQNFITIPWIAYLGVLKRRLIFLQNISPYFLGCFPLLDVLELQ